MAVDTVQHAAIDPLAGQAATLLAKAMVTADDRNALWQHFRDLVEEQTKEIEETPVREALDDLVRRGVELGVVARVVHERLGD
jgi:phosphoglycolate phosphatase-like HAD superfamily hydrolase